MLRPLALTLTLSVFGVLVPSSTNAMIGGWTANAPNQSLNGLVTVKFGSGSSAIVCSGVLYRGWVLSAGNCATDGAIEVSMFRSKGLLSNEAQPDSANTINIANTPASVRMLGDKKTGVVMIRLPRPFKDRGQPVTPHTHLNAGTVVVGQKVNCFGRGDSLWAGSTSNRSPTGAKDNAYTGFSFRVVFNKGDHFGVEAAIVGKVVQPPTMGEVPQFAKGDQGGPCFQIAAVGSEDNFNIVGVILGEEYILPSIDGAPVRYGGGLVIPISKFSSQIDAVASGH